MFLNAIAKGNIQKNSTIFQEFRQRSKDLEIVPYREKLSTFQGYPISLMISCYLTTLIKSIAMKKLITLIASAVLMCPMWAGAQVPTSSDKTTTVVGSFAPLSWSFPSPLQITPSVTYSGANLITLNSIITMSLTFFVPNNGSFAFGVSGIAESQNCSVYNSISYPDYCKVPIVGTFTDTTNYYNLMLSIGTSSFSCSMSTTTLTGNCYGTPSQGPVAATYVGG